MAVPAQNIIKQFTKQTKKLGLLAQVPHSIGTRLIKLDAISVLRRNLCKIFYTTSCDIVEISMRQFGIKETECCMTRMNYKRLHFSQCSAGHLYFLVSGILIFVELGITSLPQHFAKDLSCVTIMCCFRIPQFSFLAFRLRVITVR